MSGMSGGSSMLRARRKDVNIKPNRRLDRKSSRGMIYENEELRLRTININAEVERGQSDIKKLKRENEQLRREVGALRGEYDRLERLLKARHSEELSDAEGSNSCCSECESECCSAQNNVNDYKTDDDPPPPPSCKTESDDSSVGNSRNTGSRGEAVAGSPNVLTNGLGSCGILPAVPEEPSPRVPSIENKIENHYSTPMLSPPPPSSSTYTAVVTVPLPPRFVHQGVVDMSSTSIFPKSGLDILMNNTPKELFRDCKSPPPPQIGFVVPPSCGFNEYDDENSAQNAPNVLLESKDLDRIVIRNDGKNRKFAYVDPIMENSDNMDDVKNSYFLCNTRKVIQQLTVHNLPAANQLCEMGNSDNNIAVDEDNYENEEENKLFKTEKSIELNNDYEQNLAMNTPDHSAAKILEPPVLTTHTTTEINSTLFMFERKNLNNVNRNNRMLPFFRSHSVPVNTQEPVYATIKKVPHKPRRFHINDLEKEVTYIPDSDLTAKEQQQPQNSLAKSNKINVNMPSILKTSEGDSPSANLSSAKNESFSEADLYHAPPNVIPKSPVLRKKKRFSIHFKRKTKKCANPAAVLDDSETPSENKNKDVRNSSERLLELSSSWESPDLESTVRFKDTTAAAAAAQPKKHPHIPVKSKHCNSECRKAHRCEKCLAKKRYSPVANYLKHDSYQEMTTSHSERERTNSLSSSGHSGFSLNATGKTRKLSGTPREGNIPWCGCWGNSCL